MSRGVDAQDDGAAQLSPERHLGQEPRLADPRLAVDEDGVAAASLCAGELTLDTGELLSAFHQRGADEVCARDLLVIDPVGARRRPGVVR